MFRADAMFQRVSTLALLRPFSIMAKWLRARFARDASCFLGKLFLCAQQADDLTGNPVIVFRYYTAPLVIDIVFTIGRVIFAKKHRRFPCDADWLCGFQNVQVFTIRQHGLLLTVQKIHGADIVDECAHSGIFQRSKSIQFLSNCIFIALAQRLTDADQSFIDRAFA